MLQHLLHGEDADVGLHERRRDMGLEVGRGDAHGLTRVPRLHADVDPAEIFEGVPVPLRVLGLERCRDRQGQEAREERAHVAQFPPPSPQDRQLWLFFEPSFSRSAMVAG